MSTHPEGGGLGDPHDADRDGMLHRDPTPEEPTIPEASPDPRELPPAPEIISSDETVESIMRSVSRHIGRSKPRSIEESYLDLPLPKFELYEPRYEKSLSFIDPFERRKEPTVDGSEYVKDAFGGFGPSSPEYDKERRLTITIPNPKASVGWFKDTVVEPDRLGFGLGIPTAKTFATHFSGAQHPGVKTAEVRFIKTEEASLIEGRVSAHYDALTVADVPDTNEQGVRIDTKSPAVKMLTGHLTERLENLYADKLMLSKDAKTAVIELGDGINLHVDFSSLPNLEVTVNGKTSLHSAVRYGDAKPTSKQLQQELSALQQHFPGIVEAHADFFRKQLPKATIEVDYASESTEKTGQDPVNPQRMAQLRQELIVEPREDDFKYIGGLDSDIAKLKEAAMGFSNPDAFREFGVTPPRGILLQGPPGTGKTSLAMAFARDAEATVLSVKASTIKSAFHGETERNIRGVFQLADELIEEGEKVVIFIDEIEALAPARDSMGSSNIDKNVTTELLQGMNVDRKNCVIIAATNVPGMVDPALINNSSRFSQQLEIGLPDTAARTDIIQKLFLKFSDKSTSGSHDVLFAPSISIDTLAQGSEGLSGADLENAIRKVLFTKAVMLASTGEKPGPATNGEIYQSIKNVAIGKEKTGNNYL